MTKYEYWLKSHVGLQYTDPYRPDDSQMNLFDLMEDKIVANTDPTKVVLHINHYGDYIIATACESDRRQNCILLGCFKKN